jgi:signal transduction histidine kinase
MKSLERQLQITLAIVLVLILLGLMLIANLSTRSLLEEFVTSHLEHEATRLVDAFEKIENGSARIRWRRLDPNYNTPNSGHYYAISHSNSAGVNSVIRSPSLQEKTIPTDKGNAPTTLHDIAGPKGQHLIVWTKNYVKDRQEIIVSIAKDMSLLMNNRRSFSLLFLAIGIIGFFLILALQRIVIRRLFKHLDNSRQEIKQIELGERQALSEDVPTEIYPLVKEFNHSLSLMQQRMERSRNSLGNLAHALKTPLSLLMQQLESGENLSQAKKQTERIRQLTERELKRARMAGLGNTTQRFDPRKELPILVNVLKQAHQKHDLLVDYTVDNEVSVFGDREDMLELLGNLLDNAFKWANTTVACTVQNDKKCSSIIIIIEDDGKGGTSEELDKLTQRGTRLDESVEGHGLGLAICKDIVKLYA